MDSFEMNKMAAAVLSAGIIAMVVGFVGSALVKPPVLAKKAYIVQGVEAPAAGGAPKPAEQLAPVAPLLASANPQHGADLAKVCSACHTFQKGQPPGVGPNLYGVVGGPHAHEQGYSYSPAMSALKNEQWTYEELNAFLAHPQQTIKGTKMTFAGLPKPQDRADVIAYLRSLNDNPPPLP
jgi:cytochrome c